MNLLFLGDVVGTAGCEAVRRFLPQLKRQYSIDLTIINGENSADGNGIHPVSAQSLLDSGADVITTGNHVLRRSEIYDWLEQEDCPVIRPANMHHSTPGRGIYTLDFLRYRVTVINLMGNVYMDYCGNLFDKIDELLEKINSPIILIDLHAEATSEKLALAHYLDGKISLLAGTHTHVQTADEQIFPGGMGYITDLGMCGPENSVLGIKPELAIRKMRGNLPVRFENAANSAFISGILASIDEKTGKTTKIMRIFMK
jgi:hypothetical protein